LKRFFEKGYIISSYPSRVDIVNCTYKYAFYNFSILPRYAFLYSKVYFAGKSKYSPAYSLIVGTQTVFSPLLKAYSTLFWCPGEMILLNIQDKDIVNAHKNYIKIASPIDYYFEKVFTINN